MAQKLLILPNYLQKGDFSQQDIVSDNAIVGKALPTSFSIYKSPLDQIVFLELWNKTNFPINTFVKVDGNKIYLNSPIFPSSEQTFAHTFLQISIKKNEEIFASADKENSISYNIIV